MAATDARPVPRKNAAFRFYFAIRKNDGTLITSWAGADSEVSIDGASFSDCTNEATEIGTSGCGYIDFTSSEMNGDAVMYKLTVTNTSALTVVVTFFPEEAGDYRADVTHFGGTAGTFSGGRPEVNTTHAAGTAWGSGAITAVSIAADAITAAKVAADVTTELQSGLATAANLATVDTVVDSILALLGTPAGASVSADILTANSALAVIDDYVDSIVADVLAGTVEGSITVVQAQRLMLAALVGKLSGAATTTVSIRDTGDTKNRIVATVDADGNRSAVTLDGS